MFSRRQFLAAAALPAALPLAPTAWAQSNVVRLVVGFAAGGAADFVARQLAQNLQAELGATVVVDNRPGAGGRIAVDVARNAKPDGLTLLVTPGSILTIYPHVYDRLSYQPLRDLVPVANLCAVPAA
jgi:tripartite-type tricarboxylate transporter receptor subunit TctC